MYVETIIGHLLSWYCVLPSLQSGEVGHFPAWSSTLGLWMHVGLVLAVKDRNSASIRGFFLFQVMPRGISLDVLELYSRSEVGIGSLECIPLIWVHLFLGVGVKYLSQARGFEATKGLVLVRGINV